MYKAALWWKNSLKKGFEERDKLCEQFGDISGIYLELRYEDILNNPKSELKRVFEFIGIEFEEGLLIENVIRKENKLKWVTAMSERDKRLFEQVAGDILEGLGYSLEFGNLSPVSGVANMLYLMDNRIRSFRNVWWDIKRKYYRTMVPEKRKYLR